MTRKWARYCSTPPVLATDHIVRLSFLQIKTGILLYHLLQLRGVTGTAASADDALPHRVSHGLDERRLHLPFPHRAALTVVLLELEYAQAYAVDKESVDAEGALIVPAAANVEAMRRLAERVCP